ncbi:MAG: response regulator [Solirubrobacteraceae bacterium MAG38_C4-C5]|nr:response regulator [Candidatus Siliceabacter maunaloa]
MTLLRRVVLTNAAVLAAATAVLALSPLTISERVAVNEVAVLIVYVATTTLANAFLLRRAFDPLDRLTQLARTADPLHPGTRVAVERADPHVTELSQAMNDMLARLEDERRTSGRRALAAQEDERRRIARELHDEVGQSLTAVLLQLEAAGHRVPREVAGDLEETREAARRSLEDVRAIARRLRPDALDDLGLRSALAALVGQPIEPAGLRVRPRIAAELPELSPETQVVVYRVAQEALTNVRRHAGAHEATLDLEVAGDRLVLTRARRRPRPARRRSGGRRDPRDARARAAGGCDSQRQRLRAARYRGALGGAAVTTPLKARLLLADDHVMVRRGLRLVLDMQPDLEVMAEAGDGVEAVEMATAQPELDLAVLDVSMPRMTGLQAAAQLSRARPKLRLLMLSVHDSEQYLFEALRAGAAGYVLKSSADRDLVEACRATLRGEPFLYPAAVSALMRDWIERAREGEAPYSPLTPRELEIVKLIAESHSGEEIAGALQISPRTVERHRANVLEKLGVRDRVELTRWAIRRGLVEP